MATPTATPPAPPAVIPPVEEIVTTPPVVDPPETPPEDPPAEPTDAMDSPMMESFKDDFKELLGEEDPPEIKPVEEVPAVEKVLDAAPGTEVPPVDPPADPPKAVRKKLKIVDDAPPAPVEPPAPTTAVTPPPPAEDPDAGYIAGLSDEQKDELAEADFAERELKGKYVGMKKRLLDSYKAVDKFVQDNPEAKPEDEEFQKVIKAKPTLSPVDARKVIRGMATEEAVQKLAATNTTSSELADVKQRQRALEEEPKVAAIVEQVGDGVHTLMLADADLKPVAEIVGSKGLAEAVKEYPLEAPIIHEENIRAKALSREYVKFAKGLQKFDASNEAHVELNKFIGDQGEHFKRNGGPRTTVNGRTFLTRAEYGTLAKTMPDIASKHWTFSHEQVTDMLAYSARENAKARIKFEEEQAKARGFERRKPSVSAPAPKPTAAPTPIDGVKTGSRPGPGAAVIKPAANKDDSAISVASML